MDRAGALLKGDVVPGDDAVINLLLGRQPRQGRQVAPAHELRTGHAAQHRAGQCDLSEAALGHPHVAIGSADERVGGVGGDGDGDVGRKGPRGRGPHRDVLAFRILEREPEEHRGVGQLGVGVGQLVLGQ